MSGDGFVECVGMGGVFFCGVTLAIWTTHGVSTGQAQRFLDVYAAVCNLFNPRRHMVSAEHYRNLRISAFSEWSRAVA